jgi:putative multiple sugar transport system substrate-binding protein
MITSGVKALVIAAIDGTTLSNALDNAAAAGIKVIAYDRLIRDSGSVDYYATFDNFKVGVQQAESLVAGLKERFPDVKPWNVELFGGSPDDNNAFFFYDGAMSVLQPMIDAGDIAIPSGQMGMDVVGTLRWDGAVAQARMDNLCPRTTATSSCTARCRPMTASPSASSLRSRAWAMARAT